ncbi:hypothetical protein LPTSP4_00310 [Leptospira ryugenii]|uniref:Uncharacterized protein n=1 Tax=Leptospira ryugenii TaxID=1917863 RepID=A0A2P2DV73_9LEPT|nr:hypothetical protein [Leptospira ryugenii]GBF48532.1 hypothetical protein LPTSP4_00310 [Leptospira ryugenii]
MLKYAIQSRELTLKSDGYVQNVTYLIISRTNTLDSKETKKKIDRFFNPCLALHGYLSLQVLSRHIELFSNGALRLQLNPIWLDKTATRLNDKNYIMMSSLSPWTEDLSLLMHEITKESDLVVIAFPREGGNANANYGKLPIVPGLVQSPTRTFIKLPSEWMRMLNFPQIFHEYMHTVEFLMNRKGEKEFHATSHGADGKKVQALTGLPTETTGETDWAEVLFKRQIQWKVDDIATKNAMNGWQSLFGIRSELPNQISLDLIRTKFLEYSEKMKEKEIIQGAEEESSY